MPADSPYGKKPDIPEPTEAPPPSDVPHAVEPAPLQLELDYEGVQARETRDFGWYMKRVEELDFSTDRDKAVFWKDNDPVIAENPLPDKVVTSGEIAGSYARETGRKTLEMTPGGQELVDAKLYDHPNLSHEQAKQVWDRASQRFAEGASGEVVAFANDFRPRSYPGESTWNRIEERTLREENPEVADIDKY
jgi:hypothetical protein